MDLVFVIRKESRHRLLYKSSKIQKWQMFSESDRSCLRTLSVPLWMEETKLRCTEKNYTFIVSWKFWPIPQWCFVARTEGKVAGLRRLWHWWNGCYHYPVRGDCIHLSTQVRAHLQLLVWLRIREEAFDDENTKVQIPFRSTKCKWNFWLKTNQPKCSGYWYRFRISRSWAFQKTEPSRVSDILAVTLLSLYALGD